MEKRLSGTPLADRPDLLCEAVIDSYLAVVRELGKAKLNTSFTSYLLCNPLGLSGSDDKDWNGFLHTILEKKLEGKLLANLISDVNEVEKRIKLLLERFNTPYQGDISIVHGDLYPGNILEVDGVTTAVIDFGTFTMFGDPLFDMATASAFYRMYGEGNNETRDKLLKKACRYCSRAEQSTLYRYLLTYALLSADNYGVDGRSIRTTGHYQWAVSILSNDSYWERAIA